jgi:Fe-S cluster biogenesis protein NfuA
MFIQTQSTPNPATIQFIPDTPVLPAGAGPVDFACADDARGHPLPMLLFAVDGVVRVMVSPTFITVTKDADVSWDEIKTNVLMAIMDHVVSGADAVNMAAFGLDPKAQESRARDPRVKPEDPINKIITLLETQVRPMVANDGGDIAFSHFEDGVVYVHMHGACAGCPSSDVTLKNGIENMLRRHVPEVIEVRAA